MKSTKIRVEICPEERNIYFINSFHNNWRLILICFLFNRPMIILWRHENAKFIIIIIILCHRHLFLFTFIYLLWHWPFAVTRSKLNGNKMFFDFFFLSFKCNNFNRDRIIIIIKILKVFITIFVVIIHHSNFIFKRFFNFPT